VASNILGEFALAWPFAALVGDVSLVGGGFGACSTMAVRVQHGGSEGAAQ